jgi:hypothetical protein
MLVDTTLFDANASISNVMIAANWSVNCSRAYLLPPAQGFSPVGSAGFSPASQAGITRGPGLVSFQENRCRRPDPQITIGPAERHIV